MVKRRAVLLGVSGCVVGGGYLASNRSGSDGETMDTDGQNRGCRNGVVKRPANGTFEFVNVLHFDELEVRLEVVRSDVEQIAIGSNGETIRTVSNVTPGERRISFPAGTATTFDVTVSDGDGSVVDTARFYSRCGTRTEGGDGTASPE